MPTTIATPSASLTKMAFNEPYVSEGLNKKLFGGIPNGILRGGKLVTFGAGLSVTIDPDPVTGDSVYAFNDSAGHQLSFRDAGARVLDLTPNASSTVFVALFISYSVGSPTVVEWRTYSEAELFGGAPVPEAGDVVIVGKVVVPGVGPIAASAVTPEKARFAWTNQSKGTRPGRQIVKNGGFETGESPGAPATQEFPFFQYASGGTPTIDITGTNPRSGSKALEWVGSGPGDVTTLTAGRHVPAFPLTSPLVPVLADQKVTVSFYVAGVGVPAYTKGVGGVVVSIEFYDDTGSVVATEKLATDPATEVGTFGAAGTHTHIQTTFRAPAAGFMAWNMTISLDLAGGPATFFVDDFRIFVEAEGDAIDEQGSRNAVVLAEEATLTQQLQLFPFNSGAASVGENLDRVIRFFNNFNAVEGRSFISLFDSLGVTAAFETPLEVSGRPSDNSTRFTTSDTGDHILIWESIYDGSKRIRLYMRGTGASDGGWEMTVNAGFVPGTGWVADDTAVEAYRMSLRPDTGLEFDVKFAPTGASWADGAWDQELLQLHRPEADLPMLYPAKTEADDPGGATTWKLIALFENGSGRFVRIYAGESTLPSQIAITVNAAWFPATSLWAADVAGASEPATFLGLFANGVPSSVSGGLLLMGEDTSAPWAEGGWASAPVTTPDLGTWLISGEYKYAAVKSRERVLPHSTAVRGESASTWGISGTTGDQESNGTPAFVNYPIQLPEGSTLQRVRAQVVPAGGSAVIMNVIRVDRSFGSGSTRNVLGTDSSAGSSRQTLDVPALAESIAANDTDEWFVEFRAGQSGDAIELVVMEFDDVGLRNN